MIKTKKLLVALQPKDIDQIDISRIPSINHCVGSNRLLGEFFATSINEELILREEFEFESFNTLCMLLRSYVVLDDFLKDSWFKENSKLFIFVSEWLDNISKQINTILFSLNSPGNIFNKYLDLSNYAYNNFSEIKLYDAITNKCIFVTLVFELDIYKNKHLINNLISFLNNYLFCLQLIDDFRDIEEDFYSPNNNNLFVTGFNINQYQFVFKNRHILLFPLLQFVIDKLKTFDKCESQIINKTLTNTIDFIKTLQNKHLHLKNDLIFSTGLHNWDNNILIKLMHKNSLSILNDNILFDLISAESVHSAGKEKKQELQLNE